MMLRATGIIGGKPGNIYDPQGTATRAEIAAILARFIEIFCGNTSDTGNANHNPATGAAQTTASTVAYIDKSALEAIERAFMAGTHATELDNV